MPENEFHETIDDISISIYGSGGLFLTRRWHGIATAEWGFVGGSKRYRSRRALRRKLIDSMERHRPKPGSDVPGALIAAAQGKLESPNSDLQLIDLTNRKLPHSDFTNSNFYRAQMAGVNLTVSNLSFCNLSHVNLVGANLNEADLTGSAFFSSDLANSSIRFTRQARSRKPPETYRRIPMEAWVGFLYFVDCNLSNCNFDGADLRSALFKRCNLRGTTFENTELDEARFIDCDLTGSNLPTSNGSHYVGSPRKNNAGDHYF